jgi:hypothetical protein
LITFVGARLALYLSDWCWVFFIGGVVITMVFSLPLSKAAPKLGVRRPKSSLLCLETVLGVGGHLMWNYVFLAIAFAALWQQDWFQCRKWKQDDVGNFTAVGDSYESTMLFLVTVFQTIATAMSMNFGYDFREAWYKNYALVCLSSTWMLVVFIIVLYPSTFSCIFRVNCTNEVSP